MALTDESLYDLLSALDMKQIPIAIEVLRGRLTLVDLTQIIVVKSKQSSSCIEINSLDESNGVIR